MSSRGNGGRGYGQRDRGSSGYDNSRRRSQDGDGRETSKRQRVETSEEASTSRGSSGQGRSSGHRANPQSDKVQDRRQKKREENIRKLDNVLTRPKNVVTKIGSSGVPVQLMANFFRVSTGSNWILNNYRVDFEPEPAMTWEKRILIRRHEAVLRGFTFDGTNLYTPIHYSEQNLVLYSENAEGNVKITLSFVGTVTSSDTQSIQVYGIIMRSCFRILGLDELGRHFFDKSLARKLTSWNLEIWPGYCTAMRNFDGGICLNVDIKHKLLRTETCLQIIRSCNGDRERVENEIVGYIVITHYNKKTYKVDDIRWDMSPLSTFDQKGVNKQLREYYAERYPNFPITSMNQPLLVVNASAKDVHRGVKGETLLIPELCNLTGLSESQRLNFRLMRDIHNETSLSPYNRCSRLDEFMQRLQNNALVQEKFESWAMQPEQNMVEMSGRVLPSEKLLMKNCSGTVSGFPVNPECDWTLKFKGGMHMHTTIPMQNWAIIVGDDDRNHINKLKEDLKVVSNGMNFSFNDPTIIIVRNARGPPRGYTDAIDAAMAQVKNIQLIFVIMSNTAADVYGAIKRRCNIDYGVQSQCFQSKHLRNSKPGALKSVATKLVIQINAKLGGEPWIGVNPFRSSLTMVVGFDVHHSGKGRNSISIGAMVATTNQSFSQFFTVVSNCKEKKSLAEDMAGLLIQCITMYQRKNSDLPGRIIMYRDGLGQGDLEYVKNTELQQINECLKDLYKQREPVKFVFIIVTKKGNARIMQKHPNGIENPSPGTVVDDVITLPERFDFYLTSQQPRKGQTVSPVSYNVLEVSSDLDPEKVQRLTHKFCHLYYNWTGTVAVPFVCQYAHKLSYLTGMTYQTNGFVHRKLQNHLYFL